jgi:PAS domain S-box-containing protein
MAISLEPGARPQTTNPPAPSATETRLRLIIESAPVSLTVTTQDGTILAANARALRLFGVERLEGMIGSKFDRLVAADDRTRVVAALEGVCKGADAHLNYHVAEGASAGRVVEMRAVPLRRDGSAAAVCLAATWEIVEAPAKEQAPKPAAAPAVAPALEQALEEAKSALASMTRTREAERLAVGDALLQTRQRLQAALADAEERHTQASTQWASERDALQTELTQARDAASAATSRAAALTSELGQAREAAGSVTSKITALTTELGQVREAAGAATSKIATLTSELEQARHAATTVAGRLESSQAELAQARDAARNVAGQLQARDSELAGARDLAAATASKLTALQGELAQARDASNAASAQLAAVSADLAQTREAAMMTATQLAASNEQRLRAEEALEASRYRIAELEAIVRELEERCTQLVADRQADRVEFHEMVRSEQSKYEALVSHQTQRESALADISRLLQDAALRTERLLGDKPAIAPPAAPQPIAEPAKADPQDVPAAAPAEEDPWQF